MQRAIRFLRVLIPVAAIALLATGCPPSPSRYGTGSIYYGATTHHMEWVASDTAPPVNTECINERVDGEYWGVGWVNVSDESDNDVLCNGAASYFGTADSLLPVQAWRLQICRWKDNRASECTVVDEVRFP